MTGVSSQHSYRALATAVLRLAVSDLDHPVKLAQESARHFLTTPSPILELWRWWLGVDQHAVVTRMTRRVEEARS